MTNHIHAIWQAPQSNLNDIIRDFKTFTSKAISNSIQSDPESRRVWLLYMFRFYANQSSLLQIRN
jgi:REP element-mobilizing transposase RayT